MSNRLFSSLGARKEQLYYWNHGFRTVQTRAIVALILILIQTFQRTSEHRLAIWVAILSYLALICCLSLPMSARLRRARFQAFRDALDLVAISFLIALTGGFSSPWSLLYLFPVMSVARYLGVVETVIFACGSALAYRVAGGIAGAPSPPVQFPWLWTAIQIGVAVTASSLARMRDVAESNLVKAFEEIDRQILSDTRLEEVIPSILRVAMEITDSDLSAVVFANEDAETEFVATSNQSHKINDSSKAQALELVRKQYRTEKAKSPSLVARQTGWLEELVGAAFFDLAGKWQARYAPIKAGDAVVGMIGVISVRRLHYTSKDERKLQSAAPLVAMAMKQAKQYQKLQAHDAENRSRLKMLYEIGEQLKAEEGLDRIFNNIVSLVSTRLRSEEAALFTPNARRDVVEKVAVWGPDIETNTKLMASEQSYGLAEASLTRGVFESKKENLQNEIPAGEAYSQTYAQMLPSRTARHYLGVPLLLGDQVLGVIRVLNKKAADYSNEPGRANLAAEGFTRDDCELLALIATQAAVAIRSTTFVERNRYFKNLVYNSPDPIIVLDKGGRIEHFNKECEAIWGLTEESVVGRSAEDYYESPAVARKISRALWESPEHAIRDYATKIRNAGGILIPIRLSATLLLDKDNNRAGSIGVFKDERENLRQDEERIRAEKLMALGRIARNTGHDMKHDLGAVLLFIGGLEQDDLDPSVREVLSDIKDATNSVVSKLQNMLLAAKPARPKAIVLSLNAFLDDFEASIRNRLAAADISFVSAHPLGQPLIFADAEQMGQVLLNLLTNSIDAIESGRESGLSSGRIELRAEIDGESIVIVWRDDGCGISEDARRTVFTAFSTTKETGSGLGLYITKTIIESHKGTIAMEPGAGPGVTFRIALPVPPDLISSLSGSEPSIEESLP